MRWQLTSYTSKERSGRRSEWLSGCLRQTCERLAPREPRGSGAVAASGGDVAGSTNGCKAETQVPHPLPSQVLLRHPLTDRCELAAQEGWPSLNDSMPCTTNKKRKSGTIRAGASCGAESARGHVAKCRCHAKNSRRSQRVGTSVEAIKSKRCHQHLATPHTGTVTDWIVKRNAAPFFVDGAMSAGRPTCTHRRNRKGPSTTEPLPMPTYISSSFLSWGSLSHLVNRKHWRSAKVPYSFDLHATLLRKGIYRSC